jgi:hypothetical protein
MNAALQAELAALGDEIRKAPISGACKQTVAWCFGQLPPLYGKFHQTNESRYGDAITRLVQAMLSELTNADKRNLAAQTLAETITEHLRLLHQQLGLAVLGLKAPRPAPSPSPSPRRKAV